MDVGEGIYHQFVEEMQCWVDSISAFFNCFPTCQVDVSRFQQVILLTSFLPSPASSFLILASPLPGREEHIANSGHCGVCHPGVWNVVPHRELRRLYKALGPSPTLSTQEEWAWSRCHHELRRLWGGPRPNSCQRERQTECQMKCQTECHIIEF